MYAQFCVNFNKGGSSMLQEIIKKINEADASKELWLSTANFNEMLHNKATKVTLRARSESQKDHILNIEFEDTTIDVSLKNKVWSSEGAYCYAQVLKFNEKKFPEYENAAVIL